jgi:hypothetical protein
MPDLEIPGLGGDDPLQQLSSSSMFAPENLVAYIVFGAIGFCAFIYGKRTAKIGPLVLGLLLSIYPYFVSDTWLLYGIGIALTAGLFYWKE